MLNAGRLRTCRAVPPREGSASWHTWLGYTDALAGEPFRRDYDTLWETHQQRNYERGRMLVFAYRGYGIELPRWPRTMTLETVIRRLKPARGVFAAVDKDFAIFTKDRT